MDRCALEANKGKIAAVEIQVIFNSNRRNEDQYKINFRGTTNGH